MKTGKSLPKNKHYYLGFRQLILNYIVVVEGHTCEAEVSKLSQNSQNVLAHNNIHAHVQQHANSKSETHCLYIFQSELRFSIRARIGIKLKTEWA